MYNVLIKLIVIATLLEIGISLSRFEKCPSPDCKSIRFLTERILRIDWKPISAFPEETKLFQGALKKNN